MTVINYNSVGGSSGSAQIRTDLVDALERLQAIMQALQLNPVVSIELASNADAVVLEGMLNTVVDWRDYIKRKDDTSVAFTLCGVDFCKPRRQHRGSN